MITIDSIISFHFISFHFIQFGHGFDAPPLGKPKEHHKTLIALRPLVKGFGVRLNWSPYVPLRRFKKVVTDPDGYVKELLLGDCGVEMHLASLGCLLGERLTTLDLSRCEAVTGDISVLGNCHSLVSVLLPSCPEVAGNVAALCPSGGSLRELDLSWCAGVSGNLSVLKRPGMPKLERLLLCGCCPGVVGRIEAVSGCPLLRELLLEGKVFRGDVKKIARAPLLEVLSLDGARDVVGSIAFLRKLMRLRICRLTDCRRLTGCVTDVFAAVPAVTAVTLTAATNATNATNTMVTGTETETETVVPPQHPSQHLEELSLYGCTLITGDAAVFVNLKKLQKLVLYRTKVTIATMDELSTAESSATAGEQMADGGGEETGAAGKNPAVTTKKGKGKGARHGAGGGNYELTDLRKHLPEGCHVLI